METARNGRHGSAATRRLRFDVSPARPSAKWSAPLPPSHSGRRFVIVALACVLLLWAALYLAFRDWRARFRERANFGRNQVATAVDPFSRIVPPGVDPVVWRRAVAETHTMLVTLTGSNLLDLPEMTALRNELTARAARARPETARGELAGIWTDLQARAGPVLARHERPDVLMPKKSPAKAPGNGSRARPAPAGR